MAELDDTKDGEDESSGTAGDKIEEDQVEGGQVVEDQVEGDQVENPKGKRV